MKANQIQSIVLVLRIVTGMLLLLHGIAKLTGGIDGIQALFVSKGMPGFLAYTVHIGEIVAPLLLIVGFRTKLAALLIAFTMLVAIVVAHWSDIFSLSEHGGWAIELQAFYLMNAVVLIVTGGGKYALSTKNKWD
jgi:putative oxidoreductase